MLKLVEVSWDAMSENNQNRRGHGFSVFLVLSAALMWASIGPIAALLPDGTGVAIAAWRQIFGSVVLLAVVSLSKSGWSSWTRQDLKSTILGTITVAGYSALYFPAVQLVGVAIATVVSIGGAPLFAGLLHFQQTRHLSRMWIIGTAIATFGMALVILPGTQSSSNFFGLILAIISALIYAYQADSISDLAKRHSPSETIAVLFALSAVVLLPAATSNFHLVSQHPKYLALLLFMGIFSTSIAYAIFAAGARNIGSHTAVSLTLIEPVAATALAAFIAGEIPTIIQWLGILVSILGLVVVIRNSDS